MFIQEESGKDSDFSIKETETDQQDLPKEWAFSSAEDLDAVCLNLSCCKRDCVQNFSANDKRRIAKEWAGDTNFRREKVKDFLKKSHRQSHGNDHYTRIGHRLFEARFDRLPATPKGFPESVPVCFRGCQLLTRVSKGVFYNAVAELWPSAPNNNSEEGYEFICLQAE